MSEQITQAQVRAITTDLVGRLTSDMMIGFFFAKVDRARLAELEFQHAARALGLGVAYEGRPLEAAHYPRRIFGGQFDRRMTILKEVLAAHGVDDDARTRWLEHDAALRDRIVVPGAADCG